MVIPTLATDFEDAAALYRRCRQQGETVGKLIDCLIASVAIRSGAPVLHKDADFDAIARHTGLQIHENTPGWALQKIGLRADFTRKGELSELIWRCSLSSKLNCSAAPRKHFVVAIKTYGRSDNESPVVTLTGCPVGLSTTIRSPRGSLRKI